MNVTRKAAVPLLAAALSVSAVGCTAEGRIGEDGIEADIEGENGGDDGGG